jgi:hypothetical protein
MDACEEITYAPALTWIRTDSETNMKTSTYGDYPIERRDSEA